MAYFNEHIVGEDFASAFNILSDYIYKFKRPFKIEPLGKRKGTVIGYSVVGSYYLLKVGETIVAIVTKDGDGIDFMRYTMGYDPSTVLSIRQFFADYCDENADVYIFKP